MRGLSRAVILAAPALANALPVQSDDSIPSALINLHVPGLEEQSFGRDLSFRLDVLESKEACGYGNVTLNGHTLVQGHNGLGSGSVTTDENNLLVASWNFSCVSWDGQPREQLMSFNVDFVDGKEVEDVGFKIRFQQTSPVWISDIEGSASMTRVHKLGHPNEGFQGSEHGDHDRDLAGEIVELERMRFQLIELEQRIYMKEKHMAEAFGWKEDPAITQCDSLKCLFKAVYGKVKGAVGDWYDVFTTEDEFEEWHYDNWHGRGGFPHKGKGRQGRPGRRPPHGPHHGDGPHGNGTHRRPPFPPPPPPFHHHPPPFCRCPPPPPHHGPGEHSPYPPPPHHGPGGHHRPPPPHDGPEADFPPPHHRPEEGRPPPPEKDEQPAPGLDFEPVGLVDSDYAEKQLSTLEDDAPPPPPPPPPPPLPPHGDHRGHPPPPPPPPPPFRNPIDHLLMAAPLIKVIASLFILVLIIGTMYTRCCTRSQKRRDEEAPAEKRQSSLLTKFLGLLTRLGLRGDDDDEEKQAILRGIHDNNNDQGEPLSTTMEEEISSFRNAADIVSQMVEVEEGRSRPIMAFPLTQIEYRHGMPAVPMPPSPTSAFPDYVSVDEMLPAYDDSQISDGFRYTPGSTAYSPGSGSDSGSNLDEHLGRKD